MSLVVPAFFRGNAVAFRNGPPMLSPNDPLRRFVLHGLRDTIDAYLDHSLPLHRFAWELQARTATLAELTGLPHWRLLASMRAATQSLTELAETQRAEGWRALTAAEAHTVTSAVATLRATLTQLTPADPPRTGLTIIPARTLDPGHADPDHRGGARRANNPGRGPTTAPRSPGSSTANEPPASTSRPRTPAANPEPATASGLLAD